MVLICRRSCTGSTFAKVRLTILCVQAALCEIFTLQEITIDA